LGFGTKALVLGFGFGFGVDLEVMFGFVSQICRPDLDLVPGFGGGFGFGTRIWERVWIWSFDLYKADK